VLPLAAVLFAAAPGWHVGAGPVRACPGVPAARCSQVASWASTVPWLDCADCLPHRTVAALPPDGVAIQVHLARERPLVARRAIAWPPRIRASDVHAGLEGIPSRYGVYQLSARTGRYDFYVFVFFGRSRPTARQLAAANAELRRSTLS
jgi:hypothetical protein